MNLKKLKLKVVHINIVFDNILINGKHMEIFWFITFHTKHGLMQNHCVLGL